MKAKTRDRGVNKSIDIIAVLCMFTILILVSYMAFVLSNENSSHIVIANVSVGLITMLGYCFLFLTSIMSRTAASKNIPVFYMLLILSFLGVLTDAVGWIIDGIVKYEKLNFVLSMMSYLIMALEPPLIWLCQDVLYPGKKQGRYKWIVFFMIADVLYIIISSYTGFLFTINKRGEYLQQSGAFFACIYPFTVGIVCIFENLQKKMPLRLHISFIVYNLLPILTAILDFLFPAVAMIYVVMFFDLMFMYGVVQMERNIALSEQKVKLAKKQTQIMLSQIGPHFIYNTLATISGLCEEEPIKARDVTDKFARYLQMNMKALKSEQLIPFEQELEHTKTYLWIEKIRFEDYLTVEYDIRCTDFSVLSLTLQPLAENAVKHGITPKAEGGKVIISSWEEKDFFAVRVTDNGVGFNPEEVKNDDKLHIGLENVRKRIEILTGGSLEIKSVIGEGSMVTIYIPKGAKK